MPVASELPIDTNVTATQMAQAMFGNGVALIKANYTGADSASGIYSNGDSVAAELTPADTGVILSTGRATDVTNSSGDVNTSAGTTTNHGAYGDSDLSAIAGGPTYDAAVFEALFVPDGSTLTMQFVFSSEEYLEYVNSGFNDAIGVWVNGEQAELYIGTGDVSIDNVNDAGNENLYVDNSQSDDTYNTEMDGFTLTLTLKAPVIPDEPNFIKIGIADTGDAAYDSNLLIAGNSVQTELIAESDEFSLGEGDTETVDVLANDIREDGATLKITEINGQPVTVGSTVTLADGEEITLNEDGTFTVSGQDDVDETETSSFSYTVVDDLGNTDVGLVKLNTVPCFVAGTLVQTDAGPTPIEALTPGICVLTRDHGMQPLRWIGMSERHATGADAPIMISAGALGDHQEIALSPCHRVLISSEQAELLFGVPQVLVKAKHLVNGRDIQRRADGRPVTYVHLLFDRHEIIYANGLESESYHPGAETLASFDAETRAEMRRLIGRPWAEYGAAAHAELKEFEIALLRKVA